MKNIVNSTADPDENLSKIRDLLDKGILNALTVDTSIFDEKGKRLNKGMFSQLTQFGRHPAELLFPDVVLMEMKRHFTERLKSSRAKFSPELVDAWETLGMERESFQELIAKLNERPSLDEICGEQFQEFLDNAKAEILLAEQYVPMGELLQAYFEGHSPFEENNPKKSEFPDAIALKTIETWAAKNGKNLLVVSKDKDWKRFCENSEWLHYVSDLATALELFQTPDDVVKTMLERAFNELQEPTKDLYIILSEAIKELDWYEYIRVEADSQFEFEENEINVDSVTDIAFPKNREEFKLTKQDEESITVSFSAQAKIEFTIGFSFKKWDSGDREYMGMGSGDIVHHAIGQVDITIALPIANGAFNEIRMDFDIQTIDVYLGEIEPDWMSSGGHEE